MAAQTFNMPRRNQALLFFTSNKIVFLSKNSPFFFFQIFFCASRRKFICCLPFHACRSGSASENRRADKYDPSGAEPCRRRQFGGRREAGWNDDSGFWARHFAASGHPWLVPSFSYTCVKVFSRFWRAPLRRLPKTLSQWR
jgi:hypothetical protein